MSKDYPPAFVTAEVLRLHPGGKIVGISVAHFPEAGLWKSTDHPDLPLKRYLDADGFARLTALKRLEELGADRVTFLAIVDGHKTRPVMEAPLCPRRLGVASQIVRKI
jgi:hypothetical protein